MPAELRKPKANVFRTFLYINQAEVVDSLSALEGGDVEEVLTKIAEEGASDVGGELGLGPAKGRAGRKKQRRLEEEVRRRRTEYSATTALLRVLEEQDAIGRVTGGYGESVYSELEEQMLLEFRATIRIHPLHQMVSAGRAWLSVAGTFGVKPNEIRVVRDTVAMFEAMSQSARDGSKTFLVFAEISKDQDPFKLAIPIQERYLLVPLDDFAGRATFVGQVDRILEEDEELLALRVIRNAPQLALEKESIVEGLPALLEAFDEIGIGADFSDFVLTKPTVLLKPICIFK